MVNTPDKTPGSGRRGRRKARKTAVLHIRITPRLLRSIHEAAEEQQMTVTDFVAEALRAHLHRYR